MRMLDLDNNLVQVDVRPSKYPLRGSASRSKLQQATGEALERKFFRHPILEEFTIPGTRLKVDFFIPTKGIVIEVQGRQHDEHVPFFHGDRETSPEYAKQLARDSQKVHWAKMNNFEFVEIRNDSDLKKFENES